MAVQTETGRDEFKFPDEQEAAETAAAVEAAEGAEEQFEVVEEDDTPEQDRGREPLDEHTKQELEEDNLEEYSEKVKTRIAQMKKAWHDERRAKEAAAREREEAIRLAQRTLEMNKQLQTTLSQGEQGYVALLQEAAVRALEAAKRDYAEAYESGDTEKIVAAQEELSNAQHRARVAFGYKPQYAAQQTTLQPETNAVNSQPEQSQTVKPDAKAVAWQEANEWFGSDREMTATALGVHETLVNEGINPKSDEYYKRLDNTMRKRYPEYFGVKSQGESQSQPSAKPTVVAPATRSTAPKRIVLTTSQIRLAKKLGLTPEQYAREQAKLAGA